LGTASYPDDAPFDKRRLHAWKIKQFKPQRHLLSYALGPEAGAAVETDFEQLGRDWKYRRISSSRHEWVYPAGCAGIDCVYDRLHTLTNEEIAPLAARFRKRADAERLTTDELLLLVTTFVQDIPYKLPPDTAPFGLETPTAVAYKRRGDCDGKSLLLVMLLEELGFEAILLVSEIHAHAFVGVVARSAHGTFDWNGRRYAPIETTARLPIGYLAPRMKTPWDWKVAH